MAPDVLFFCVWKTDKVAVTCAAPLLRRKYRRYRFFSEFEGGTGENSVETFEEQKGVNKPGIAPGYRVSPK